MQFMRAAMRGIDDGNDVLALALAIIAIFVATLAIEPAKDSVTHRPSTRLNRTWLRFGAVSSTCSVPAAASLAAVVAFAANS